MAETISVALDAPTRRRARRRAIGAGVFAALMAFSIVLLGRQVWRAPEPAATPVDRTRLPAHEQATPSADEAASKEEARAGDGPESGDRVDAAVQLPPVVIARKRKR
jgi:hypothetical protein